MAGVNACDTCTPTAAVLYQCAIGVSAAEVSERDSLRYTIVFV